MQIRLNDPAMRTSFGREQRRHRLAGNFMKAIVSIFMTALPMLIVLILTFAIYKYYF